MTGMREISGVGTPDAKLCGIWVQLRNELRQQLTHLHNGTIGQLQYDLSALEISRRYAAHRLSCSHPQHTNASLGWDSSRRVRSSK